jgi:hypothetical protein
MMVVIGGKSTKIDERDLGCAGLVVGLFSVVFAPDLFL